MGVLRLAAVFLVALCGYGLLAGPRLFRPSANDHFVHLADAWWSGRLHHDGRPPGYCDARARMRKQCTAHRYDDWAVVWTLELREGGSLRGFPCRTRACADVRREQGVETWWILGEGWVRIPARSIASRVDTWFVGFPPGPALAMLPFVAVFGTRVWDVLVTAVLGALIPVVLVRLLDRLRGDAAREHLWIAAAWAFGSPACVLAANGQVWFTAQIVGALCLVLHLEAAWGMRRPVAAGVWLGLAVACRPMLVLAGVFALHAFWVHRRSLGVALRFMLPFGAIVLALAWLNWARFEDPLEFGHRFLDIRWQSRIQEHGMFSFVYLRRNLECLLVLLPVLRPVPPYVAVSIHGMALWLTSPWIVIGALGRRCEVVPERRVLWLAAVLVAIPGLLYQNSGQMQFSYRFAVDWLPMVVLALACGGAVRVRGFRIAVVFACLVQAYGAYQFGRAPGRLFVTQPFGWPFESEYEDRG